LNVADNEYRIYFLFKVDFYLNFKLLIFVFI